MRKEAHKFILFTIVFIELGIVSFVGYAIYVKRIIDNNILGSVSINRIRKENLIFPPNYTLKYYYEAKPNVIEIDQPEWLSYKASYTLNAEGFNERFDYNVQKSPHTFRIITLGDSFTFGHYVNTADNWPEKLEDMLNTLSCALTEKFEVINLGERGYDMQYAIHRFKRLGFKYQPDLVLFFLHGERYNELMTEKRLEIENSLQKSDYNKARKNEIFYPSMSIALEYVLQSYKKKNLIEQEKGMLEDFTNYYQKQLVFMTLPTTSSDYKMRLKYLSSTRPNTIFYDKLPDIYSLKTVLPDGHPNKEGYELIANNVISYLLSNSLIPCK